MEKHTIYLNPYYSRTLCIVIITTDCHIKPANFTSMCTFQRRTFLSTSNLRICNTNFVCLAKCDLGLFLRSLYRGSSTSAIFLKFILAHIILNSSKKSSCKIFMQCFYFFLTEETLLSRLAPDMEALPKPTDQQLPVLFLKPQTYQLTNQLQAM